MRLIERLGHGVVARPILVIVVTVLVALGLSAGAARYELSADYRIFFAEDDPMLQALERLERTYRKTDNIVFVVRPRTGDVFQPEALQAISELTERAWELPWARRVDSLSNHPRATSDDDGLRIEPLVPAVDSLDRLDQVSLDRIRRAALDEPMLVGSLVAADGGAAGVNVVLALPDSPPDAVGDAARAARALVAEVQPRFVGVEIRASGLALLNDAFMRAAVDELSRSIPLIALIVTLALGLLLRDVRGTAAILVVVVLASGAAMGVGGWLGLPLTPVAASAPTIVATLSIADGVHLFLGTREGLARGMSHSQALRVSLRDNFRPILWTSASTIVGFLALDFAESPPFWHMGNMTAAGVAVAFLLSITLLPALLSLSVPAQVPSERAVAEGWSGLGARIVARRWSFVAVGAVLAGLAALAVQQLERDDQFVDYFDHSVPWRADTEFLLEHLGGLYVIDLDVPAPEGTSEPAYLRALDEFGAYLREQPGVTHVSSLADLSKRLRHAFGAGPYAVPPTAPEAAQLMLAYELSLPERQSLQDRVAVDKTSSRVTMVVGDLTSEEVRALAERSEQWLVEHHRALATPAVSPVVLFSWLSELNTARMTWGNLWTLVLISGGLIAGLRSVGLGLASLVPNVLPILFAYAAWALLFGSINLVGAVGVAVCLGLVVDDTIHFLVKYRQALQSGLPSGDALAVTLQRVGPALVTTSVVLVAGFSVLTTSPFAVNRVFGQLVVLVVVFALLCDLLLLPACLAVLPSRPSGAPR